jgi:hypothetical protein
MEAVIRPDMLAECALLFSLQGCLEGGSCSLFGVGMTPAKTAQQLRAADLLLLSYINVTVARRAGFIRRLLGSVFTGVGRHAVASTAFQLESLCTRRLKITNGDYCC